MIKKFACKSSHFVWNSKINRIIRTIFRTNKTVFLPPPFFFKGGVREGLSGVRRRPGTQASPPAFSRRCGRQAAPSVVRVRRRPRLLQRGDENISENYNPYSPYSNYIHFLVIINASLHANSMLQTSDGAGVKTP